MSFPTEPDPSNGRSWNTSTSAAINALACFVGTISLIVAVPLVILTFFDRSPLGNNESVVPFILIFPLWIWMFVILFHRGYVRTPRRPWGRSLSRGNAGFTTRDTLAVAVL